MEYRVSFDQDRTPPAALSIVDGIRKSPVRKFNFMGIDFGIFEGHGIASEAVDMTVGEKFLEADCGFILIGATSFEFRADSSSVAKPTPIDLTPTKTQTTPNNPLEPTNEGEWVKAFVKKFLEAGESTDGQKKLGNDEYRRALTALNVVTAPEAKKADFIEQLQAYVDSNPVEFGLEKKEEENQ